jgi:hypothetical protein
LERHGGVVGGLDGGQIQTQREGHAGAEDGWNADHGDAADGESERQRKGETGRGNPLSQPKSHGAPDRSWGHGHSHATFIDAKHIGSDDKCHGRKMKVSEKNQERQQNWVFFKPGRRF